MTHSCQPVVLQARRSLSLYRSRPLVSSTSQIAPTKLTPAPAPSVRQLLHSLPDAAHFLALRRYGLPRRRSCARYTATSQSSPRTACLAHPLWAHLYLASIPSTTPHSAHYVHQSLHLKSCPARQFACHAHVRHANQSSHSACAQWRATARTRCNTGASFFAARPDLMVEAV